MLNQQTSVKSKAIYSKQEISTLYNEFKSKLTQYYNQQSQMCVKNLVQILQLIYYLSQIPSLLKQLNQFAQVQLLATMEVLFMKCQHLKQNKQILQKWISITMKNIGKYQPKYQIKAQIENIQFMSENEQVDVEFLAQYFEQLSKTKNQQTITMALTFFRIFLINQLQNKKRVFIFTNQTDELKNQWRIINQNLIKIGGQLNNIKKQQICVSISYWLCTQNKKFIKQCVLKGIILFLCQTLAHKNITQRYGKKILSFLKLLLVQLDQGSQYFTPSDIQGCIAQFTLVYDNETVLQQSRNIFCYLNNSEGKIQQYMKAYQRYNEEKDKSVQQKNLQNLLKSTRILVLYSEDEKIKNELNEPVFIEFLAKALNESQNIVILTQIFNIIAFNCNNHENDILVIEKLSKILNSFIKSKDKLNEIQANNKRILLNFIRIINHLGQSRQFPQKLMLKIKNQGIITKLGKLSDCKNLKYEKQLLSLIKATEAKNKQQHKQSIQIMMNVLKMINESPKKLRKKLQEQLDQIQLLHELLQRKQGKNIREEIIQSIVQKIYNIKNDTESVQITMLDQSDEEKNREMLNRINYLAICSLINVQSEESQIQYSPEKIQIDKIINIGLNTDDMETLKSVTQYLILLASHNKLDENQRRSVGEIFNKCKQKVGEDLELLYYQQPNKQKPKQIQQASKKQAESILQKSMKQRLSLQQEGQLKQILDEQSETKIEQWLQKFATFKQFPSQSSLNIILRLLVKHCNSDKVIGFIFNNFKDPLFDQLGKCSSLNENLIFKIFTKTFDNNFNNNKQFFKILLNKSYDFFTQDSISFTNACLSVLQYGGSPVRQDQYWKYIYNMPEMIGRQASFIIKEDPQKSDKFWFFFGKQILKNIEEQKKLTLQFLELCAANISRQLWKKFNLNSIVQKIIETIHKKNCQIHSKGASETLLRKIIRLSKSIKHILKNQNIDITEQISNLYQQFTKILITHPNLKTNSQSLNRLSEQYVKEILEKLKYIYKRREGYKSVKKQIAIFETICRKVSQYKNPLMNDTLAQVYRILFLRDDKHQEFPATVKMYNQSKELFMCNLSGKGKQDYQACQNIIKAIQSKDEVIFKKLFLDYFFFVITSKQENQQGNDFSERNILKYLRNLENPPYQYGINFLQTHLKLVQNSQYANTLIKTFNNSHRLFQDDKENQKKSLQQIQHKIVDSIWGQGCHINGEFYNMIKMNLIGLKVCLKTKGIGLQGIDIICQKIYQYPEEIPLCAQILHINVSSNKEWSIVSERKIPQIVNKSYKQKGNNEKFGKALANFIGSSSKLKAIQSQYKIQNQLFVNLQTYAKNIPCLAATLYAISGLVYLNDPNQKILAKKQNIKYYMTIIERNQADPLIFQKGCNLLSNLVYKNTGLVAIYLQLGIQSSIINIASNLGYDHITYKQFLRFIGNLSLSLEGANSIVKTKFLFLWGNILKQAQEKKHEDIIKYAFDIIFNLLNFQQTEAKDKAVKIQEANCLPKIIQSLRKHCLVNSIVESGLDSLQKLLIVEVGRKQALESNLLQCMEHIAQTQSSNQKALQKWIKLLKIMIKVPQLIQNLLKTQIFSSLALFIRQHPDISTQNLNSILNMTQIVFQKSQHTLLVPSGFVLMLANLIKIKHMKNINATTIIDYFNVLHNEKILKQQTYIDVFGGLISRLQIQFRDENSKKIISSIIKFRDHITIDTHSAAILLEFSSVFMTQSQIITSRKYQKRVKEFLCLLTYFISFSEELKLIFNNEGFIEILQSWIKIDKSLDEQTQVRQACRICMFAIMNQQKLLVDISNQLQKNRQKYIEKLSNPTKCLLYRRDHSNKGAIIQIRRQDNRLQLVAYKAPDGQIKQKYTSFLNSLICIRAYYSQQDPIFKDSIFSKTKNVFQKDAVALNCLTLVGIVGDELSVRQFDVEFSNQEGRDQFQYMIKGLISLEASRRKYA